MIQTEPQSEPILSEADGDRSRIQHEVSILDILVVLLERKRFILRFVLAAAVLAAVVSVLLPIRYEAKVLLLPPAQNSSIGSSLMNQLGNLGALGSLASLAGGNFGLKNPGTCMFLC